MGVVTPFRRGRVISSEQERERQSKAAQEIERARRAAQTRVTREILPDGREYLVLRTPYDNDLRERLHDIGGARWDAEQKVWRVPVLLGPVRELGRVLAEELGRPPVAGGVVLTALEPLERRGRMLAALSRAVSLDPKDCLPKPDDLFTEFEPPVDPGYRADLFSYQKVALAYAAQAYPRLIIGDDVGAGKTVMALAIAEQFGGFPLVIVSKKSAMPHWERHIAHWLPGHRVARLRDLSLEGDPRWIGVVVSELGRVLAGRGVRIWPSIEAAGDADVLLITWQQLSEAIARPGQPKRWGGRGIILDESHHIKSKKSQRTQNALALARGLPVRLELTATLIVNRTIELASQLQVIGRMQEVGGFMAFARRFAGAHKTRYGWDMTRSLRSEELHELLRSVCYIRREQDVFWPHRPGVLRERVDVELPPEIMDRYRAAERDLAKWLRDKYGDTPLWVSRSMGTEALLRAGILRHLIGQAKSGAVAEWVEDFVEDQPAEAKVVVFAHHKDVIAWIAARLRRHEVGVVTLTGSDTETSRKDAIDAFQNDPRVRVFLSNIDAGGESIELVAGRAVVFAELAWTPKAHLQAIGRVHRPPQNQRITAHFFVARGTVDDDAVEILEKKMEKTGGVIEGDTEQQLLGRVVERAGKEGAHE